MSVSKIYCSICLKIKGHSKQIAYHRLIISGSKFKSQLGRHILFRSVSNSFMRPGNLCRRSIYVGEETKGFKCKNITWRQVMIIHFIKNRQNNINGIMFFFFFLESVQSLLVFKWYLYIWNLLFLNENGLTLEGKLCPKHSDGRAKISQAFLPFLVATLWK